MSFKSTIKETAPVWMLSLYRRRSSFRRRIKEAAPAWLLSLYRKSSPHSRRRLKFAMSYVAPQVALARSWANSDSEESNFLYALTPISRLHLAHIVAVAFDVSPAVVKSLFDEIETDHKFQTHISESLRTLLPGISSINIGRRLGWYAVTRLLKPRLIVETGVDFGLGSCVLCAALLRNAAEGSPGRYIGTELRTDAGQIFTAPYSSVGEIKFGDSLESLKALTGNIELFINDSDHSPDYEAREYETIKASLSDRAVILGDNSHWSPSLADFSENNLRPFIFFREEPAAHWYPGAGIGFSLSRRLSDG